MQYYNKVSVTIIGISLVVKCQTLLQLEFMIDHSALHEILAYHHFKHYIIKHNTEVIK